MTQSGCLIFSVPKLKTISQRCSLEWTLDKRKSRHRIQPKMHDKTWNIESRLKTLVHCAPRWIFAPLFIYTFQEFKRPALHYRGPQGFWGSGGKWLFIFRELGSTGTYLQGFGEHALSFGDLGSTKKVKKNLTLKDKPSFRLIFFF